MKITTIDKIFSIITSFCLPLNFILRLRIALSNIINALLFKGKILQNIFSLKCALSPWHLISDIDSNGHLSLTATIHVSLVVGHLWWYWWLIVSYSIDRFPGSWPNCNCWKGKNYNKKQKYERSKIHTMYI